ncbi:MAG: ribosome small subunit-dependent GTPase A [Bacteroidetes bacterium]|nr:MAG: ribosome small subunit-dependent GTPase A [Bacteroidota bacterium]
MQQKGLIMRSTGSWYEVQNEQGQILKGRLRGKIKLQGLKVTNPIAVGDHVFYEEEGEGQIIITDIEERQNYIVRKSPQKGAFGHLLAANLDQAILVATVAMPRTSLGFLDRFLVSAESFRIPTVVVFNKIDILSEQEQQILEEYCNIYEKIGYPCLKVSALESDLTELENLLEGKKTLVSGHSGVGKSTLINRIAPQIHQKTDIISNFANKGKHTTTFAEMFEIRKNTYFIDTPGIKELGLKDMERSEISHYFPEMREVLGQCKYPNCMHINEPKCEIKTQVLEGKIAESRYKSYLSMLDDDDNRR